MQTNFPKPHSTNNGLVRTASLGIVLCIGMVCLVYLGWYWNQLNRVEMAQAQTARTALQQTLDNNWKKFEHSIRARLLFLMPALEEKAQGALHIALEQLAKEHPSINTARINTNAGEAMAWYNTHPNGLPPKMASQPSPQKTNTAPQPDQIGVGKLFTYKNNQGQWHVYGHWRCLDKQGELIGTIQLGLNADELKKTIGQLEKASQREMALFFFQGAMLTTQGLAEAPENLSTNYMATSTPLHSIPGMVVRSKPNSSLLQQWGHQALLIGILYASFSIGLFWLLRRTKQDHRLKLRKLERQHTGQQQRVQLAFDNAGLCMWEFTIGQTSLVADPSFYTMHGIATQAVLGVDEWLAIIHPKDRSTLKTLLLHTGIHGQGFECTYAITRPSDQQTRYLQCRANTQTHTANVPTMIVGVTADVTTQKQYERALQEMEARFRTSFEWAAIGMAIISPKGHFLQVNHALCAMLAFEDQELLNMQASGIIHPQEIAYHQKFLDDIFKRRCDSFHLETRCQNAHGAVLSVFMSVAAVRQQNGRVLHFVVHVQDITERKRQEAKLLEREHFLRTLSECLPGLVSYWDTNLHCQFANQNHSKWIGMEANHLRGQHLHQVLGDTMFSLCQENITHALQGKRQRFEMHLVTQDHKEIDLLVHFIPDIVRNHVNGFFAISTNVSILKSQQRELEQINQTLTERTAQAEAASKAKGAFLANMSHEIRTPMNGIMGVLQLLEDTTLSKQQQEYIEQIGSAADVLLNVLNDILDLSRVEANKLELDIQRFDLEAVLNKSIGLFNYRAQEKKIRLFCVKDLQCPVSLEGDALRLAQVLNNLLSNAIKFTEQGHIEVQVKCSEDQQQLEWQVKDTGIGMNDQQCQALFKPFSQVDDSASRRYGGAGLGLSICKNLIELMGGSIRVQSTPKEGTQFTFTIPNRNPVYTLPASTQQEQHKGSDLNTAKQAAQEERCFEGQTILVADDHKLNRLVASEMLKKWGATVVLAENGLEAVAACQQQPIDLVLMDLQMPEMDGFAATAAILETFGDKAPPIVAVTASTSERDRQAILAAGMAEHVTKPFKKEKLKALLLTLCTVG